MSIAKLSLRRLARVVVLGGSAAAVTFLAVTGYRLVTLDYRYLSRLAEGDALMEDALPFQAGQSYTGALELDPTRATAFAKRAAALEAQGDLISAAADLEQAVERSPDSLSLSVRLARLYHRMERFEDAAAQYRRVSQLDPNSPYHPYQLGIVAFRAGREAEAIEALNRAASLRENFWEAVYVRGAVFQALGAEQEAESDYLQALEMAGGTDDTTQAREALIDFYLDHREPGKAVPWAQAQIEATPHRVEPYLQLARARRQQGLSRRAIETVGIALEQAPNSPEAYFRLGELWLAEARRDGDPIALDKAISALESVAKMDPDSGAAALALGQAYLTARHEQRAFEELQRASEATPVEPEAHRLLGDLYYGHSEFDEALSAYHVYVKLRGDTPVILDRIGETYLGMDKPEAAGDIFLQMAGLEPGRVAPLLKAARAYLEAGDIPAAARACRRGLALSPRDQSLLQLLDTTRTLSTTMATPVVQ